MVVTVPGIRDRLGDPKRPEIPLTYPGRCIHWCIQDVHEAGELSEKVMANILYICSTFWSKKTY